MTTYPRESPAPPAAENCYPTRRVRKPVVRLVVAAVAVLVVVWGVADYRAFESQEGRATDILAAVGGERVGSIGGWLIGRQSLVRVNRELTADEVDQLAELGRLGSGHTYTIWLYNWTPSAGRLDELRRKLGKRCTVLPAPTTKAGERDPGARP